MAGIVILPAFISVMIFNKSVENREPPAIVIRVDDIQDFAFREAQIFLIKENIINQVPFSLAIIAGMFGEDSEIVQTVKLAISSGSEVAAHGWEHEDFARLLFDEQVSLLGKSRSRIKDTLDFDVKVFVPPVFSFSKDTIAAMHEEGYSIISASTEVGEPGSVSDIISLPATVELTDFSNGTWIVKSPRSVKAEISRSVQKYGFAIIVTHPQEFMMEGELNKINTQLYRALLSDLKKSYSFTTLERLSSSQKTGYGQRVFRIQSGSSG